MLKVKQSLWGLSAGASLCLCALINSAWEAKLFPPETGFLLRGEFGEFQRAKFRSPNQTEAIKPRPQRAARPASVKPSSRTFQKITEEGGIITAQYGFVNFNNDALSVNFAIAADELEKYKSGYGYSEADLSALQDWRKQALDQTYKTAVAKRLNQQKYNELVEGVEFDYKAKRANLIMSRGFTLMSGNVISADIPAVVKRNVKNLRPTALAINRIAEGMGYDSDSIINAAVSMVQTALFYEIPEPEIGGRHTGGIYPPLEAMSIGRGDCDTKTALLASILLNWDRIKIVGIGVPRHYLMGVLRNPAKGDAFVDYKGLKYVLVEPAGPAWLMPGTIGTNTAELLNAREGMRIEPFTVN